MTSRRLRNLSFGTVAILFAGCASGKTPSASISESSRDKVTSVEIDATSASSAFDLVSRLRPQWLRQGGTSSIGGGSIRSQVTLVYLDGNRIGGLDALRSISSSGIRSME